MVGPYVVSHFSKEPMHLAVAAWMLAIPVGCLVAYLSMRHDLPGERVSEGRCRNCGYDLRASKKTCPECGTAIAAEAW